MDLKLVLLFYHINRFPKKNCKKKKFICKIKTVFNNIFCELFNKKCSMEYFKKELDPVENSGQVIAQYLLKN